MDKSLATILRPTTVNETVGQCHLINDRSGIISRILNQSFLASLIFYGNAGVGKSTIVQIFANDFICPFGIFSAAIDEKGNLEILSKIAQNTVPRINLIQEIQRTNRDRQDLFLQYLGYDNFILMTCTTVNPYFVFNPALRTRCLLFEFKQISSEEMSFDTKNLDLAIREKLAIDTFHQICMTEGLIPFGSVVTEMALSEKSNSPGLAGQKAYNDALLGKVCPTSDYIKRN
uniref:Putative AAA domain-containing protein YrvN n=1 Tax=Eufriesea mexicana TaxID=516756 RepID=A0A310SGH2_9HYME